MQIEFDRNRNHKTDFRRRIAAFIWLIGTVVLIGNPIEINAQSTFRSPEAFTEPWKTVEVASSESGVLRELLVREGERVEKDAVLGRLDSKVLTAALNEANQKLKAQGKINGAKAALKAKAYHLKQMKSLLEQEHASDKEVQQAQLEFDLAQASVETAEDEINSLKMNVKKIEAQLGRRIVRAPLSGTVLELPRQVGEAITASESQVAKLVVLDRLRVRYFLPTSVALNLRVGQTMAVEFPEMKNGADAIVDFVSPVTDSKSGTVRVELLIQNDKRKYRSGMRCLLGSVRLAVHSKNTQPVSNHK